LKDNQPETSVNKNQENNTLNVNNPYAPKANVNINQVSPPANNPYAPPANNPYAPQPKE